MIRDRTRLIFIILIVALIVVIYKSNIFSYMYDIEELVKIIKSSGPWVYVIYLGLYIVGGVFLFPGSILAISGGLLFGPFWGVILCLIGSSSSAAVGFLISRYVMREYMEHKLKNHPLLKKLEDKTNKFDIELLMIIRFSPGIPFSVKNYICGLTALTFKEYFIGSVLLMVPSSIMYAYTAGELFKEGFNWSVLGAMGIALIFIFITYVLYKRHTKVTD